MSNQNDNHSNVDGEVRLSTKDRFFKWIGIITVFVIVIYSSYFAYNSFFNISSKETLATSNTSNAILDLTFKSSGGSSGLGTNALKYRKNGQEKEYVFEGSGGVVLIAINNDSNKQVAIPTRINASLGLSSASQPYWVDIYDFDFEKERLVIASNKYPRYYQTVYIPKMNEKLQGQEMATNTKAQQAIRKIIEMANEVVAGKFVPDESHQLVQRRLLPDLEVIEHYVQDGYIMGVVKNNTSKKYDYVEVDINLYDGNNNQVGNTMTNVTNLEPGGRWKFKAVVMKDNVSEYSIQKVVGR